jgi:hypothetical protein
MKTYIGYLCGENQNFGITAFQVEDPDNVANADQPWQDHGGAVWRFR